MYKAPFSHDDSGGTLLTVDGDYLDSVAEPKLTITGVVYTGDSRLNDRVEFEISVKTVPTQFYRL